MLKVATIFPSYFQSIGISPQNEGEAIRMICLSHDYIFYHVVNSDTWNKFIDYSQIVHATSGGSIIIPIIVFPSVQDPLFEEIKPVIKSRIEVGFLYGKDNREKVTACVKELNQKSTILFVTRFGEPIPPPSFPVDMWSMIGDEWCRGLKLFGSDSIHEALKEHIDIGWPKLSFLVPSINKCILVSSKDTHFDLTEMTSANAAALIKRPDTVFVQHVKCGKTGTSTYYDAKKVMAISGEDEFSRSKKINYIDESRLLGLVLHDPLSLPIGCDEIPRSRSVSSPGLISDRRRVRRLLRLASPPPETITELDNSLRLSFVD